MNLPILLTLRYKGLSLVDSSYLIVTSDTRNMVLTNLLVEVTLKDFEDTTGDPEFTSLVGVGFKVLLRVTIVNVPGFISFTLQCLEYKWIKLIYKYNHLN